MIIKKLSQYIKENKKNYFQIIDYTNLNTLTNDDVKKLCQIAEQNKIYSVCVLPEYVSLVSSFLESNEIKVVATVDFPKGTSSSNEKIKEIDKSLVNGADEIDVVLNYKLIKDKDYEKLEEEIRTITEYTHKEGKIVKFIIEVGVLSFQEIEAVCEICVKSNVDFIMTSTGKLPNDGTFEDKVQKVKFIRKITPDDTKIKFSGGIRTNAQIEQVAQFCDRIGTSTLSLV